MPIAEHCPLTPAQSTKTDMRYRIGAVSSKSTSRSVGFRATAAVATVRVNVEASVNWSCVFIEDARKSVCVLCQAMFCSLAHVSTGPGRDVRPAVLDGNGWVVLGDNRFQGGGDSATRRLVLRDAFHVCLSVICPSAKWSPQCRQRGRFFLIRGVLPVGAAVRNSLNCAFLSGERAIRSCSAPDHCPARFGHSA
jgi:hypothetical protein